MFVLIYSNWGNNVKENKPKRYYLPKDIFKDYIAIINRKNVYDLPIDYNIKLNEHIKKLTTGQRKDYKTACLLLYDNIKKQCNK